VKYVRQRCLQRVHLLKLAAGVSWGARPSCLILLYRGLIGSVLEYGLFYEYGKDAYAEFGKGSVPIIEDCIGSDGIYSE
jgi:hypothetical protein